MCDAGETDVRTQTLVSIRNYIFTTFPHARRRIRSDDDPLLESGVVDSLGVLEIVNFLVESFGIEVTDEDLNPKNFRSIAGLAAFVDACRKR